MAEKEERIYVTKIQPECKFRELHETTAGGHTWVDFMCGKSTVKKIECDEKCFEQCEWKELTGISHKEAIEKIAKAVCMRTMYGCERCVFGKDKEKCEEWIAFNHIRDAEAALNALLGK